LSKYLSLFPDPNMWMNINKVKSVYSNVFCSCNWTKMALKQYSKQNVLELTLSLSCYLPIKVSVETSFPNTSMKLLNYFSRKTNQNNWTTIAICRITIRIHLITSLVNLMLHFEWNFPIDSTHKLLNIQNLIISVYTRSRNMLYKVDINPA
jgi:hypothetical protein